MKQKRKPDETGQTPPGRRAKPRGIGSKLTTVLLVLILLVGIGIFVYPTFSDWWNSFHQSRAIAAYVDRVNNASDEEIEAMLSEAQAYNAALLRRENRFLLSEEEKREYASLLDITGTGIMGYVQIDTIGVSLPVYHGTEESVLQIALGHLMWSSLPIGGENTHALISGHRGLPSARLFTDLDKLQEGDIFTVTVLNRTATYQVDQIRIVEPTEVDTLGIVSGGDYCTLITCTPYGVNTHRLLVRGVRVENAKQAVVVTAEATRIPSHVTAVALGVPMMFLLLLGMLLFSPRRKRELTEEELMTKL